MTDYGTLSYPDYWPLQNYSPTIEDVQRAYINDKVADVALDNELEWALSKPEPPAPVLIEPDECAIFADDVKVSQSLADLNDDSDSSVTLELEQTEVNLAAVGRELDSIRLTITCQFAELERAFDAIMEADQ